MIAIVFVLAGCADDAAKPADSPKATEPLRADPPKPTRKIDLAGSYTLSGQRSDGTAIEGSVTVKHLEGSAYLIARTQGDKKFTGTMYREGDHVFAAWSNNGAGLRTFTINDDGSLDGTYFGNTYPKLSKEVLVGGTAKMTGMYRIVNAAYADGSAYTGTASITLRNDIYQVSYQIRDNESRESFMAYGLRGDNHLGIASHAGGPFGFAHYTIADDRTLAGENGWSDASTGGVGKETLKK